MIEDRSGDVVTFYSFKGGTGRTMAMANVAWILAASGKRVMVVDWDLESPGLDRFFSPFISRGRFDSSGGVVNLLSEFKSAAQSDPDNVDYDQLADLNGYKITLDWEFPGEGRLDFVPSGPLDPYYASVLAQMNWDDFYERQGGGLFLDVLRANMKRDYDYTFVDSRTGLSDIASICTMHLPDVLVDCFTLSEQGIFGAAEVARQVKAHAVRNIRILPVPMRIDNAEKDRAEIGLRVAKQQFAGLPALDDQEARTRYWNMVQVPYQPYYAYEETLACFGDAPGTPMLSAYGQLASAVTEGTVTGLPPMDEGVRLEVRSRFRRPATTAVFLKHSRRDELWAEWIRKLLEIAKVRVFAGEAEAEAANVDARPLTIISNSNFDSESMTSLQTGRRRGSPIDVYVETTGELARAPQTSIAKLPGLSSEQAIERILSVLECADKKPDVMRGKLPRYPGERPRILNVQQRNSRFTGRERDLGSLRARLMSDSIAYIGGSQRVALQGMGGVGKTQVALEYAHRFGAGYDIVWWIDADPIDYVDASLADLANILGVPVIATDPQRALSAVRALSQGGEGRTNWLLIFDNADNPEDLEKFLPNGPGHVIVTSRDAEWLEHAPSLQVDVFLRRESIAHILDRAPRLDADEADAVAEILGDLPIAVNAAAAWLATTGLPVQQYLDEIKRLGVVAITDKPQHADRNAVQATWDLSLRSLSDASPAAFRLLQLCSLLAPEIALEMLHSSEFAEALAPYDPDVSEPMVRAKLVNHINRLGLLRIDSIGEPDRSEKGERRQGNQVVVHRLLQLEVRNRMSATELAEVRHHVHSMLAKFRPDGEVDEPALRPRFRLLWPHLAVSEAVNCSDEAVRRLLIDRVRYLWLREDFTRARTEAMRTDDVWSDQLAQLVGEDGESAPEHLGTWKTLRRQLLHLRFNHANVLRQLGEFEQSYEINKAVLAEQRELLGESHPHTLMTANSLAADLRALGRYAKALEADQATAEVWREVFGERNRRTLVAISNLAVSHRLMGEYETALDLDLAVLSARREILGEYDPLTLLSGTAVGRDLREAGDYPGSLNILEQVAEGYAKVSGPDARPTMNAQANLAVSLRSAGRAEEAAELLDLAYERLNDSLGSTSPDTLACRLSRSVNLLAVKSGHAEDELKAVQREYERQFGPRHPHTLVCINNLAMIARDNRDVAQAATWAQEAATALSEVLGENHPYTLAARTNVAVCAAEAGRLAESLETITDTLQRIRVVLGDAHPDTLRCVANQALIRRMMKEPGQDRILGETRRKLGALIGVSHPAAEALSAGRLLHRVIDPHPF